MSFLERNFAVLQEHYGMLSQELTSLDDELLTSDDIKIETAATGEPSLCVRGLHVHSLRDPVREGQRLAQAVPSGSGAVVILGFGLGYAAQAAVELGRPVIIVEKYKSLLLKAFELRDLTGFLSKKNIMFIVGGSGDGITSALAIADELSLKKDGKDNAEFQPYIAANKALVSLDEEWYKAIENKIRTWKMRDDVNAATLKRFGRRWVRNLSRNMNAIRDCPGISRLPPLEGIPVFLAAAGPSLDKIKPLLHDIYNRCVVVAVDTNLRFFINNGIQPDFVLVVDPQFWNSRHLDRCISGNTVLIAESAVYPPVLRLPFKRTFLCGSLFPLGTFIENQVDPKGRLGAGGSVATTAWDFARSIGGSDIWIAGLDLAFPELKTHFRGARFEEKANSASCRFNPVETWVVRALRDGIPFKGQSSNGTAVLTDRRLSLYAAWFENQFRQHGQVRNFALFQDGLAIKGLEARTPDDLLALPERRSEINRKLEEAFLKIEEEFNDPQKAQKRTQAFETAVSTLKRGLTKIKTAAEEGALVTTQAMKRPLNSEQQNKVIRNLDEITQRIADSEVKEIAGFLFPSIEGEGEEEANDAFGAYLKSSHKLFSSLAEAVRFNLESLD